MFNPVPLRKNMLRHPCNTNKVLPFLMFWTAGASSTEVKKPFVEFTSKLDDVEVLDDSGKASVTVTWNYLARHVKYQDKFSGFFVSFGKVDENDINCKGRRYTSYNPLVVKRFCYETLKITKVDKQGKLRTTNDLKAKLKFTDLKFSDSGKYYCRLTVRTLNPFFAMSKVSEVNLRVVGKWRSINLRTKLYLVIGCGSGKNARGDAGESKIYIGMIGVFVVISRGQNWQFVNLCQSLSMFYFRTSFSQ